MADPLFPIKPVEKEKSVAEEFRRIHQSDIPPQTIKARHVEDAVIKRGLAADLPTEGSQACWAYFETDTGILNIWNDTTWVQVTLS